MKFIANVIWFIIGGLISFLLYTVIGVVLCITIIGIPFGLQFFKLGQLMLAPFGKEVVYGGKGGSFILNMIWIILFGWGTALISLILGLICCITIIGIPVGIQVIKFAKLALMPFGAEVRKKTKPEKPAKSEQPTETTPDSTENPTAPAEAPAEQPAEPTVEVTEVTEAEVVETTETPTETPTENPTPEPTPQPQPPVQPQPPTTPPQPTV